MPTASGDKERRSERLGLRATDRQRTLLLAASEAEETTISDFVLRHATIAAEDVLADRRVFSVPADDWERFAAALDRPAKDVPGLRKLMKSPTILDDA